MKYWTRDELRELRRLREGFLRGEVGGPGGMDYWKSAETLGLYEETFGARIGWKWDAVLDELVARGWAPGGCRRVVDWGCGSGVAGRRVVGRWSFEELQLSDRSRLAMRYAEDRALAEFPAVKVSAGRPEVDGETLLVVSHVLNELTDVAVAGLVELARGAGGVIWVEAGTHDESRRLIELVREPLRDVFGVVAPCTHAVDCGMRTPENARHWCHSFARPPVGIFHDGRWAEFAREVGIDLRTLPFSFLVMAGSPGAVVADSGLARVIGRPRKYKGYQKVLRCAAEGVGEVVVQKRDREMTRWLEDLPDAPIGTFAGVGGGAAPPVEGEEAAE